MSWGNGVGVGGEGGVGCVQEGHGVITVLSAQVGEFFFFFS